MKILAEKLRDLRDQALSLKSLKPGEGYDALGFALCDIVAQTNINYSERQAFFSYLDTEYPGLVRDLQQISIQSEVELDRFHAKRILDRLKDVQVREKIWSLPIANRLPEILHEYPHGWIYARTQEVIRLLKTLPDQERFDNKGTFFIVGRSNLPLTALGFHLTTGCPVVWFDPYKDSEDVAHEFIEEVEILGLLKPGDIHIRPGGRLAAFSDSSVVALMVLDDNLMNAETFQLAVDANAPVITVDPLGLAQLLYPYSPSCRPSASRYKRQATVLAQHCSDEKIEGVMPQRASSAEMFLSLSLYTDSRTECSYGC